MLGVSMSRLYQLFRHQTIHRTPEAYIDNLRTLAALRLLREKPNYTIAVIAEEAGFANVRTLQRRIQDAIGMSPVDYRLMLTRDLWVISTNDGGDNGGGGGDDDIGETE